MPKTSNNKFLKDNKKFAKYLNLPFEIAIIVGLFVFGGIKLDKLLDCNFPIFTLAFTIIGLGISIYVAIKDLIK